MARLNPRSPLAQLAGRFPRPGRVEWIGLRLAYRAAIVPVSEVRAETGSGLLGDHSAKGRDHKRQVTLVQFEHLPVIAALAGAASVTPAALRRNLVVGGINLAALVGMRFQVGGAVFEGTGPCYPCSRMEEALGAGGYNAVRGHGGITARVVVGGWVRLGDAVTVADGVTD